MSTTTPILGLPKPEGTDLISQGYDAIADLADAVEARLRPLHVVKLAAQSVTGSGVLVNDTHLFLDLPAGNYYEVVAHLAVSGNGTNDFRAAWSTTGGVATRGARSGIGMAPAATAKDNAAVTILDAMALNFHAAYGTATDGSIINVREEFLVQAPTAGRLQLQWAQLTAGAGNTTVWNSSWLRAIPVGKI